MPDYLSILEVYTDLLIWIIVGGILIAIGFVLFNPIRALIGWLMLLWSSK